MFVHTPNVIYAKLKRVVHPEIHNAIFNPQEIQYIRWEIMKLHIGNFLQTL